MCEIVAEVSAATGVPVETIMSRRPSWDMVATLEQFLEVKP